MLGDKQKRFRIRFAPDTEPIFFRDVEEMHCEGRRGREFRRMHGHFQSRPERFRRERESGCRRGPRNCGRGFLSIICPYRRSGTSDEQKRLHFGGAFFVISKHRANQIFHKFTLLTWLQQILILGDSSQCTQQPPHGASLYPFFIHTRKKRLPFSR